jgi:drug/metabolite transporter (DMT)-like permease
MQPVPPDLIRQVSHVLGALYAALAALTFALNNAMVRRGVVTGSVAQAMAVTVPLGGVGFLLMALVFGELPSLFSIPPVAAAWLAGQGVVHFVIGRFFNYRASQLVGVNLSAPIIQLQVVVTMLLAVVAMHEPFTLLQAIGTVLMLGGSFSTQRPPGRRKPRRAAATAAVLDAPNVVVVPDTERQPTRDPPRFAPRYLAGFLFSFGAALGYGISPLMVRVAFENSPEKNVLAGGVIAYAAATAVSSVALLWPEVRRSIRRMSPTNGVWFVWSAIFVAVSQGLVYASLAVAPLMVVTPILQLSLVFRLFLSQLLNREHEVLNARIIIGSAVAILGAVTVSLHTEFVVDALALPETLSKLLRFRLDAPGANSSL